MCLGAFERTNLKSKKVKSFYIFVCILCITYVIGLLLYSFGFNSEKEYPMQLFMLSRNYFIIAILFFAFFFILKWQILRTGILALILLSLAHIFCSIIILMNLSSGYHMICLISFTILFITLFIKQSNLRTYYLDKAYYDIFLELTILLLFTCIIGRMVLKSLK